MLDTLYSNGSTIVRYDTDSHSTVTTEKGKLPTLDDLARQRALNVYMMPLDPPVWDEVGE